MSKHHFLKLGTKIALFSNMLNNYHFYNCKSKVNSDTNTLVVNCSQDVCSLNTIWDIGFKQNKTKQEEFTFGVLVCLF